MAELRHGITKAEVLRVADLPALFSEFLGVEVPAGAGWVKVRCPQPGCAERVDKTLGVDRSDGGFRCHHCESTGDIFNLIKDAKGCSYAEALEYAAGNGSAPRKPRPRPAPEPTCQPPTQDEVNQLLDRLWEGSMPKPLTYLREQRGLSDQVILEAELGVNLETKRITIPVRDADGELLYLRSYNPTASKKMLSPQGSKAVLYGVEKLQHLKDDDDVIVTEGELDALKLRSHGLNAVCGTGGAKCWREPWSKALARFVVVVIGDNDKDGQAMNEKAATSLVKAGANVRVLEWPEGTPEKTDPTDFMVKQDHSVEEFQQLIDAAGAPAQARIEVPGALLDVGPKETAPSDLDSLVVRLSDVKATVPEYDAEVLLRRRALMLWWALPGTMKTYLALCVAMEMTQKKQGDLLLGIEEFVIDRPWKRVLWLGDEESAGELRARADVLARGQGLRAPKDDQILFADATGGEAMLDIRHVPELVERFRPDLVVCDPLANLSPATDDDGRPVAVDLDNTHALRRICRPLRRMCKQQDIAVLLLHHPNASGERERGPTAYRGSADLVVKLEMVNANLAIDVQKNRDGEKPRLALEPIWTGHRKSKDNPLTLRYERTALTDDEKTLPDTAKKLLAAIRAAGPLTRDDVKDGAPGKNKSTYSRAINLLKERKLIEELPNGRLIARDPVASGD